MKLETAARMASDPSSTSSKNFCATESRLASGQGWNLAVTPPPIISQNMMKKEDGEE